MHRNQSMEEKRVNPLVRPPQYRPRWPWAILILICALLLLNHFFQWYPWPWLKTPTEVREKIQPPPPPPPQIVDFGKIQEKTDLTLGEMILKRKQEFGLQDSVDMVVKPEESIRIGQETVSVRDILAEIESQMQGLSETLQPDQATGSGGTEILEEDLSKPRKEVAPPPPPSIRKSVVYYGVYVVRPGDNLWNIHFNFLREYFKHRGIALSSTDDEAAAGRSSGVAKILKYAETMVHIFNMKTKKLDHDLHMLEPHEKVVIFNLTHLNNILGPVMSREQFKEVRFDGRSLCLTGPDSPSR